MSELRHRLFEITDTRKGARRYQLRREQRREIVPGFPNLTPFTSQSDLNTYFSGEKIQCMVCGKMYRSLGVHLLHLHSMSADEYREALGIPWTYGLTSEASESIRSAITTERVVKNRETYIERLKEARKLIPRDKREKVAATKRNLLDSMDRLQHTYTECPRCGSAVEPNKGRKICIGCKAIHREAVRQSNRDKAKRHYYKDLDRTRELLRKRAERVREKKKQGNAPE